MCIDQCSKFYWRLFLSNNGAVTLLKDTFLFYPIHDLSPWLEFIDILLYGESYITKHWSYQRIYILQVRNIFFIQFSSLWIKEYMFHFSAEDLFHFCLLDIWTQSKTHSQISLRCLISTSKWYIEEKMQYSSSESSEGF